MVNMHVCIFMCLCVSIAKIAIDWVSDKLYWTDYTLKTINVIDLHTGHRKSLFNLSSYVPVDILADPNSR